nr:hypothetical protein [Chitinophaga sp. XS-30]
MDKLTYHYNAGTNKLNWVHDSVPAGNYDVDIDEQEAGNYAYDAIGNLISDSKDSLLSIEWTVYGKIKRITKANGTVIDYTYDASGNRLSKQVNDVETRYIRDATGNVMSIYVSGDAALNGGDLTQREVHLYGSSRLGIMDVALNVENPGLVPAYNLGNLGTGLGANFTRGKKFFELGNHLGNVMATVRDSKEAVSDGGSLVDYYVAKIVSAQDYYPFGMLMVGRGFDVGGYRYGFNGQEKSDEIKGEGNSYTAEFWEYDPRTGRRLNVDIVAKPYESSYLAFGGNPMLNIDPSGADTIRITNTSYRKVFRSLGGGLDGHPKTKIPDIVSNYGNIDITQSEGEDVWEITNRNILIDENEMVHETSKTYTLLLNNPATMYRSGGHNMPGYVDDRYALAANSPAWLLEDYAKESKDIGVMSAAAYQKSMPFVSSLNSIMNTAYTVTGAYAIGRFALSKAITSGVAFSANGGYGLFGRGGLSVGGYKMEAMYANPAAGEGAGTLLSIKQSKRGGALFRWDYGKLHTTGKLGYHSTIRFHWKGIQYGNTSQRNWYPSSFMAPFFKPIR